MGSPNWRAFKQFLKKKSFSIQNLIHFCTFHSSLLRLRFFQSEQKTNQSVGSLPSCVIRLIKSWRSCDRMHSSSCGRLKSSASYTEMPILSKIWKESEKNMQIVRNIKVIGQSMALNWIISSCGNLARSLFSRLSLANVKSFGLFFCAFCTLLFALVVSLHGN